jgi:electron transfer flavoprotein beta subunit
MRAVVAYTWARDVAGAVVRQDGTVEWRNAKMSPGEDDHAALAAALAVTTAAGDDLVGLTIGNGDASWALARGVEQAVQVTDATALDDDAATAAVLAAGVRSIGKVDLVLIGDSEEHPGVPVALAAHLGWPAVVGVATASLRDGRVEVVRTVDDLEETLSLALPVVVGVAARSAETRAPGMKELLAARKRPVTRTTLAELPVEVPVALVHRGTHLPPTAPTRVFDGDPGEAARQLVAALRNEGVL